MLEKYGFDDNCEGCRFKRAGLSESRAHSEQCRNRLIEQIRQDPIDSRILDKQASRTATERPESIHHNMGIEGEEEPHELDGNRTPRPEDEEMETEAEEVEMATEGEIRQMIMNTLTEIKADVKDKRYKERYVDTTQIKN